MPRVPGGETLAEELRLCHCTREVQHARSVVVAPGLWEAIESHCPTRGGEPARQLDGRGDGGGEEDEGAQAHRSRQC